MLYLIHLKIIKKAVEQRQEILVKFRNQRGAVSKLSYMILAKSICNNLYNERIEINDILIIKLFECMYNFFRTPFLEVKTDNTSQEKYLQIVSDMKSC